MASPHHLPIRLGESQQHNCGLLWLRRGCTVLWQCFGLSLCLGASALHCMEAQPWECTSETHLWCICFIFVSLTRMLCSCILRVWRLPKGNRHLTSVHFGLWSWCCVLGASSCHMQWMAILWPGADLLQDPFLGVKNSHGFKEGDTAFQHLYAYNIKNGKGCLETGFTVH